MKLGIIGCGYVGLSTAISFALKGYECYCCDIIKNKINMLQNGILPFYEDGLQEMYDSVKNKFKFGTDINDVVLECDILLIAVATPCGENGRCDTSYLLNAINSINNIATTKKIIIIKSTCEVGTTRKISKDIKPFISVIFSPEFLAQGQIKQNIIRPQRLVFGILNNNEESINLINNLYSVEKNNNVPIVITDYETAELAKYSCNSFLAMKISYINKISQLCEKVGANINDIEKIMKLDDRIGEKYLQSGIGFGGSCFPKDLRALEYMLENNNINKNIIHDIIEINNEQIDYALSIIRNHTKNNEILILGSTFKKNTSDITNSPSLRLIERLIQFGYHIHIYDCVMVNLSGVNTLNNIVIEHNLSDAVKNNTEIVIASDWEEFREILNYDLHNKNIYDFKKLLCQFSSVANIYGIGY